MSILTDKGIRSYGPKSKTDGAVKYVRREKEREVTSKEREETKSESNTVKESKPSKIKLTKVYDFDEYLDMKTCSRKITSEAWAEKMAMTLVKWVEENENALKMTEFYQHIGMYQTDFCTLANKYPLLAKAKAYARMVIGTRRELGALTRKFDAGTVNYTMPVYDPDWKEMVEWRSSLKQLEGKSGDNRTQYVIIPEVPRSDLVKERSDLVKEREDAKTNTEESGDDTSGKAIEDSSRD